jgi:rSAM/selenodomain-associated transferase 1
MSNERSSPDHRDAVVFLTKWPEPGRVKTRLGQHMGQTEAAELYSRFVLDLANTLGHLPCDTLCFYDPSVQTERFAPWLGPSHRYVAQQGHDLGQRMTEAFTWAFTHHYERVVVIGTDSPDLPLAFLQQALDALHTRDITIGPSQDGGYYLIGFSRPGFTDTVFEDIAWSTPRVYQQTCDRISQTRCQVHTLPAWYDVDTQEDLVQLIETHTERPSSLPRTMAWLKEHGWLT